MKLGQGGQSLISALIGIGIATMTILVVITMQQIASRQQAQTNFTFQADSIRRSLKSTLNSPASWARTVAASENSPPYVQGGGDFTAPPPVNAGLNCFIAPGSDCKDGAGNPLTNQPINVVREANGTVVYNIFANNGFTIQGTPCNGFVAPPADGNDACPLRFTIVWSAVCGATCTGTTAVPQISVIPIYNPAPVNAARIIFNPAHYSAFFNQGTDSANCWIINGGNLYNICGTNVGVGTVAPRATLDVSGAIIGKAAVSNAGTTINFAAGNHQFTSLSCTSAFRFNNLKDGGAYMFVVQGTAAATCPPFVAFSDAGITPLTVHMPPDNGNTIINKHTIFNIAVVGTHVYVAWTPGY